MFKTILANSVFHSHVRVHDSMALEFPEMFFLGLVHMQGVLHAEHNAYAHHGSCDG